MLVPDILDYALKHEASSRVSRIVPPRLNARVIERVEGLAARAYDALGLRDAERFERVEGNDPR